MGKTTKRVLAGVAVAALATAGVAAVMRYRQGQKPRPDEHAHPEEVAARLDEVDEPDKSAASSSVGRVVKNLERNHGSSVTRLRRWISGLRHGTLSEEEA